MELFYLLLLSASVIILSGIISGSEAALLSVSYPKIKEMVSETKDQRQKKRAEKLLHIKEYLQYYITTIVVLNNIVNIIGSVYVGVLAAIVFGQVYVGVVSGILTFLIILFSEIIPKIYGERYASQISPFIAPPLLMITFLLHPVIWVFTNMTNLFIHNKESNAQVSEGVIKEMAALGSEEGSINTYESTVISNVFEMNDIEIYEIMVPRSKVIRISALASYDKVLKTVQDTGFTRFPIEQKGELIGVINAKDLFKYHDHPERFSVEKILRPIEFAPESMKIFALEQRLKRKRHHMAAVVNEHGDFVGIVTLEDIIEELLGDIEDEFDQQRSPAIKKVDDSRYMVDADYDIEELNDKMELDLELEEEDFTTLNGFMANRLGRLPAKGDSYVFQKGVFTVKEADNRKAVCVELKQKQ